MASVAVVILSCSKPKYTKKREEQQNTYKLLKDAGMDVFILLSDTILSDLTICDNDDNTKYMYSPVPEDYEYLALRLWSAYKVLSKTYTHILKMDDDINFVNLDIDTLIYSISFITQFDYVALKDAANNNILETENRIALDEYHWGKCTNPIINRMYINYPVIKYAGGPFYLLSSKAINNFIETDFKKCILEDISVGIACKKYGFEMRNMTHIFRETLTYETVQNKYNTFFIHDSKIYNYMINS